MASSVHDFLRPLHIELPQIQSLARSLCSTFVALAAESQTQFLATPISEEVLRPRREGRGKFLAIDIGGTNLRVGFIELLGPSEAPSSTEVSNIENPSDEATPKASRVLRHKHLEKAWPIGEHLKNDRAEELFEWIGRCIAEVVLAGSKIWADDFTADIPLGVSFSFPMIQETISKAKIMAMGKGFAITTDLDLATQLQTGYELARAASPSSFPNIKIVAITNDAVATLISFTYQHRTAHKRRAAMGLIAGTGSNATIPLTISKLHPAKRPSSLPLSTKLTINTEWTLPGASQPLHDLRFFTRWDKILDAECSAPGFQPFEYMTSGRYLGELGRIIIHEYLTTHLHIPSNSLPEKLRTRMGLTTSFLGNLGGHLVVMDGEPDMVKQLDAELPSMNPDFYWTRELADVVFTVGKAVQVRAAGMTAAAVIGLLGSADELSLPPTPTTTTTQPSPHVNGTSTQAHGGAQNEASPALDELMVGYTGGCIVHFQDYLADCQAFLDRIMAAEFGTQRAPRVVLMPCHDGGILGAGILAGTVMAL